MSGLAESDTVGSIMVPEVVTVKLRDPLRLALKKMVTKNIGSIVVVDGGKPVGIITERDVSRNVARGGKVLASQVGRLMSRPLVSVPANTTAQDAMAMLLKHGIRRLPVIENQRLLGIVTERDILRWVLKVTYEPNIPSEIMEILQRPAFAKA